MQAIRPEEVGADEWPDSVGATTYLREAWDTIEIFVYRAKGDGHLVCRFIGIDGGGEEIPFADMGYSEFLGVLDRRVYPNEPGDARGRGEG